MKCMHLYPSLGGDANETTRFKHFEQQADVQMLAMLSCVFAEMTVGGSKSGEMNLSVQVSTFVLSATISC